MMGKWRPTKY